ncbi:fimbrial protein [Enterobacter sp. PI-10]|uniref:fimbrial protein n=1 Tax=Enterobacter sp. PI-10 TaxID=2899140 RepID=UPI002301B1E7|nr:fimbrial protein [Enterobacter sp. PI-10]MDA5604286.1 fimbrial protein [Enterobacter sp. PI-10]
MHNVKYVIEMLVFIFVMVLPFLFLPLSCFASWSALGVHQNSSGNTLCPVTPDTLVDLNAEDYAIAGCQLTIGMGNQVPRSDFYRVVLAVVDSGGNYNKAITTADSYIDAGSDLSTSVIGWAFHSQLKLGGHYIHICYMLADRFGDYFTFNNTPQSCPEGSGGSTPLPSPFQCAFGDGSTLNISLGDVDRTEIGAVPGTLPGTEKNINITCTGDGSATYTIGFEYTAINIDGTEMVSSSANGLAVAVSLNDELVNPTDTYTRTYSTGTQTEKLTFEPVRDPSVKIGDIPTGAFSASAVMVLTLQ